MTTIDRIQELLEHRNIPKRGMRRALERTCGISYQAVSQWFTGETSNIKNEHLAAIAQEYGSSLDWLISGKGPMIVDQAKAGDSAAPTKNHTQLGVNVTPEWMTAKVPVMDQAFSAGHGAAAEKLDDFIDGYRDIGHSDLAALNIQPGNARIIKIRGDSMWSTLWDGDEVLADTHVPRLVSGKIYAFEFDGDLKVKRFTKKMDGSWLISSDNKDDPAYTDEVVSQHNAKQLRVIAEVKKLVSRNL
jgi:phage repressor protein C with HTH and peptisase S24 domain